MYTPEDIGVPDAWITSVAIAGTDVYIGTSAGLVVLSEGTFPPDVVVNDMATGLVGNWVSNVDADSVTGMVWTAHQGSVYYKLNETAVKRFWESPGGVSVWNGLAWTTFAATKDNYGHWTSVRGFSVDQHTWSDGRTFPAQAVKKAFPLFSGSTWQYQTTETRAARRPCECHGNGHGDTILDGNEQWRGLYAGHSMDNFYSRKFCAAVQ